MQIGALNRRIEVLEPYEVKDSFGAMSIEWIAIGKVWAKINPGRGGEKLSNQQVIADQLVTITIRFYPALSVKHRVKYQDMVYEILAVADRYTDHRWTEITAQEVRDGKVI